MFGVLTLMAVLGALDPILPDGVFFTNLTGCTNTAINVATQCEFKFTGFGGKTVYPFNYHAFAIYVSYARNGGTGYTFHLDTCIEGMASTDCTDASDWFNIMSQTATGPYTDLDIKQYRRSVSANDYAVFIITAVYPRLRAHTILCTGGGCTANDKITIQAIAHTDTVAAQP